MVDFVRRWGERTGITIPRFIRWLGMAPSKFFAWRARYGQVNEHIRWIPRDFWLEEREKQAIIDFHDRHPLEGTRRLTFMMLDQDIVAVRSCRTNYGLLCGCSFTIRCTGGPGSSRNM